MTMIADLATKRDFLEGMKAVRTIRATCFWPMTTPDQGRNGVASPLP
jgi:hypothetical protein